MNPFIIHRYSHPLADQYLTMAKGSGVASSPPASTPALKRSTSSTQNMKNQRSILGFFQKSSPATPSTAPRKAAPPTEPASSPAQRAAETKSFIKKTSTPNLTPAPSSDAIEPDEHDSATPKVRWQGWDALRIILTGNVVYRPAKMHKMIHL